jgi:hypothetical protein
MPDELLPPWAQLATFSGLITLVVLSLIRGWLVPKSTVDRLMEQSEKRLADRDELIEALREQNNLLDERNDLLAAQVRQLVDMGHSSLRTITDSAGGVPRAPEGRGAVGSIEGRTKAGRPTKSRRRSR